MAQPPDPGTARRYRLKVSMTRSESVALVVEGSLEKPPRCASSGHESPASSTNPELSRLPSPRSHESSRKLLDRRRQ